MSASQVYLPVDSALARASAMAAFAGHCGQVAGRDLREWADLQAWTLAEPRRFWREFVAWSQSVGASALRTIWRHILPNAMAPVLVAMTLGIPAAILTESGLSFLGLGVQPPYATWGNILNEGKDAIELAWWLSVYPGLAILVTVLSYNLLGECIRDALDPRLRQTVGRLAGRGR